MDFADFFAEIERNTRRSCREIIFTRPPNIERTYAENVERIQLQTNYIRLTKSPQWAVHKYHVTFDPDSPSAGMRNYLMAQHKQMFGGYLFDGLQLFVTKALNDSGVLELRTKLPREGLDYTIHLKFTKIVLYTEDEMSQILNLILRRATAGLGMQLVKRNYYDAQAQVNN